MYAHQVVETLKLYRNKFNFDEMTSQAINVVFDENKRHDAINSKDDIKAYLKKEVLNNVDKIIKFIIKSQHFHFNFMDSFGEFDAKFENYKAMFNYFKEVRLPYYSCWFDWEWKTSDNKTLKICILSMADKENVNPIEIHNIRMFCYQKEDGWRQSPYVYTIKNSEEIEILRHFDTKFAFKSSEIFLDSTTFDYKIISLFLYSLLLLNCKNIITKKIVAPDKLNQKRKKKGRQELFSYHTLLIKPIGKKQESIPKRLWDNRIHLCRGHFKTYTKEKPLFGHIIGRFWWQPVVRGKNKKGIVLKDYEVRDN